MSRLPLVVDCDPGCDDAAALLLALAAPELELVAVTTVSGNVPLTATTANARRVLEFAGHAAVPVYAGCARPLLRAPAHAREVHGHDGLGGVELPPAREPAADGNAVTELVARLGAGAPAGTPPVLVAIGPLTNLACALAVAPDLAALVPRLVVMGGGLARGNVTPFAEFNFHADPHAARAVVEAGFRLTLVPLDLTLATRVDDARRRQLAAAGRAGALLAQMWAKRDEPVHDACAVAALIAPDLFEARSTRLAVDSGDGERGGQVVEHAEGTPATVLARVDVDGFYELLCERLASLG